MLFLGIIIIQILEVMVISGERPLLNLYNSINIQYLQNQMVEVHL